MTHPVPSSRLLSPLRRSLFLSVALLAYVAAPAAQAPKVGRDVYEDSVELGLQIKVPKDWDLIPKKPNEKNIIAKYSPRFNKTVTIGGGAMISLDVYLLRFDQRSKEEGDGVEVSEDDEGTVTIEVTDLGEPDIQSWVKNRLGDAYGKAWRLDKVDWSPIKGVRDVDAVSTEFDGVSAYPIDVEPQPVKMYVAEFPISKTTTFALVGFGPGDSKKWREYSSAYEKMAKTFKRVEIVDVTGDAVAAVDADTPRGQKRIQLQQEVAKSGDWQLYETPNYFVISANDDKEFLDELMERLEAIHAIYEVDYPAEKARSVKKKTVVTKEGGDGASPQDGDEEGDGAEKPKEEESVSAINPMELARTSVVRVCRSASEYHEYGGPGGSAGYWSSRDKELVIYDDKNSGGREDTWLVLNHEAFHQYIYYFYGQLAPHSWYNEGTGDFYSGYKLKNGKFIPKESAWRQRTIQGMMREGKTAPLKDFVRWSQSEYYGSNELGLGGGECYAQGWSFIYFLRTGEKNARGWQRSWGKILDNYLETLASTGDEDEAVDVAFKGVDWDALEDCWKKYIQ